MSIKQPPCRINIGLTAVFRIQDKYGFFKVSGTAEQLYHVVAAEGRAELRFGIGAIRCVKFAIRSCKFQLYDFFVRFTKSFIYKLL